jgi:hypothetical protein
MALSSLSISSWFKCGAIESRRWRVNGRLSRCPDGRRDVVLRVMGELREDGFRRLADLGERLACRDGSFRGWLWRVARNAAVSHVREQGNVLTDALPADMLPSSTTSVET